MIRFSLFCFLLLLTLHNLYGEDRPPLEFTDGDRVILLGDGFIERDLFDGYLETVLTRQFPGQQIVFRNMGWTGDTVQIQMRPLSFGDLESNVTHQRPTAIFVNYGMNDSFEGPDGLEQFRSGYERILDILSRKVLRSPPWPPIVVLSPIFHEDLGPPLPDPTEHNRALQSYVAELEDVAYRNRVRFVNLFDRLQDIKEAEPTPPLTDSGIHLTPYGYWRAALELGGALEWSDEPWQVTIADSLEESSSSGAEILELTRSAEAIQFRLQDDRLPLPVPPQASTDSRPQASRILTINGLAPGRYSLTVDGVAVATADERQWAAGVQLDRGPDFDQIEELRQTIVRKNQLFFFRWRPYNTEYIFGRRSERRGANVGNPQFAEEFREFDRLIEEAEAEIWTLSAPQPRTYRLERYEGSE